jgi:hypothetical protein
MTLKDLLETAQLDALGLLDDDEAAAFDRAFRAAPQAIQARLREAQARVASSDALLADVVAPASLRPKVLGGVYAAMRAEAISQKAGVNAAPVNAPGAVVGTIGAAPSAADVPDSALTLSSVGLAQSGRATVSHAPSAGELEDRMDVSGRRRRVSPAWRAASLALLMACVVLGGSLVKVYSDSEQAMRSLTDQRSQESFLALFGNSTQMRDVLFSANLRRVLFTPEDGVAEAQGVDATLFVHPDWSNSRLFVRGLQVSPTVSYRLVILNADDSIKRELGEVRTGSMLDTQQFDVSAAAPGTRLAIVMATPGEPAKGDRVLMRAVA